MKTPVFLSPCSVKFVKGTGTACQGIICAGYPLSEGHYSGDFIKDVPINQILKYILKQLCTIRITGFSSAHHRTPGISQVKEYLSVQDNGIDISQGTDAAEPGLVNDPQNQHSKTYPPGSKHLNCHTVRISRFVWIISS
jgi:hypothetical protein